MAVRVQVQISRDWARRVILAVAEREARLEAMERFRGVDPPRFVCPECHEFGCSTSDALGAHLRDNEAWHAEHAALEVGDLRVEARSIYLLPSACPWLLVRG